MNNINFMFTSSVFENLIVIIYYTNKYGIWSYMYRIWNISHFTNIQLYL